MKRSLSILLLALGVGIVLFAACYVVAQRVGAKRMTSAADDLDWLRQEFRLSDTELARVRELHEGYMPRCVEMCKQIAEKKREVEMAMSVVTNTADLREPVGRKLGELALLRAQCQLQMLQHFVEVSKAMPREQGRRYLAEMQRVTFGSHEQIEQSMSSDHEHGH